MAYKNLRRARVKYRTTVLSIVVGVAVFIGMTTFMHAVQYTFNIYYENKEYQLRLDCYDSDAYEKLLAVGQMEGVEEAEIVRSGYFAVPMASLPLTEDYLRTYNTDGNQKENIKVYSLGRRLMPGIAARWARLWILTRPSCWRNMSGCFLTRKAGYMNRAAAPHVSSRGT